MTDSPNNSGPTDKKPKRGGAHSATRRRWLQAGISAAPIIMTVASRPVLAQTFCQTPSGFASLNASNPGGVICQGSSATTWKNSASAQSAKNSPSAVTGTSYLTKPFTDVFTNASVYSGKKLLDVLNLDNAPPNDVGKAVVAAYLNNVNNLVPSTILPLATVQTIWSQYITTGVYSPRNGVSWNNTEIVSYLSTTMPN